MVKAEAADQFLAAPWLGEMDPESRRAVLEALAEDRMPAGAILLAQGQPNDHLSFLIAGSVAIERTRGGQVETLVTLSAPSVFGTTSFFSPEPPTFNVRATSDVVLLTLYHSAHDQLRRENPAAAEALAVAAVRVLSQRFNELDRTFSEYMAGHPDDHPKVTEWAGFRARLFEESAD